MKRFFLLSLLPLILPCCTKSHEPRETNYYVDDSSRGLFRSEVESLSGQWIWNSALSRLGVYAEGADNLVFYPRAQYDGAAGTAEIFGPAVKGKAYAYLPYSSAGYLPAAFGCIRLGAGQVYFPDAAAHIEGNTPVLVAAADDDGFFRFRYPCGVLKVRLKMDLGENIRSLTFHANEPVCGLLNVSDGSILNPGMSVTVDGMDLPCSESAPAEVWVMLPEGSYTGAYVSISYGSESVSTIINGGITIRAGQESSVTAQEEKNACANPDFESEEVEYD